MTPNEIAHEVVDAAFRIHSTLGPGLLEHIYERLLAHDLQKRGLQVVAQHPVPFIHEGVDLGPAFRADLIIEHQLILEIKSVEALTDVHKKQLLTYLRLANKPLGLLINFNVALIKNGIKRIVNNLKESPRSQERT